MQSLSKYPRYFSQNWKKIFKKYMESPWIAKLRKKNKTGGINSLNSNYIKELQWSKFHSLTLKWTLRSGEQNTESGTQGKTFSITVIRVYAPNTNAEEAEVEQFYEDLHDLLELTWKKKMWLSSQGTGMQK